jgi:hypothetical protein
MIWGVLWRSILVGIGYIVVLMLLGMVGGILSGMTSGGQANASSLLWLFISGVLIGVFLGPLASRMPASRGRHLLVWTGVIFFNMGSVAIEGAYFVPELVSIPLPVLFGQQLFASIAAAFLITRLFAAAGKTPSLAQSLSLRPWHSWAWRLAASSLAYFIFYYVFGTINYRLVTEPYYAAHVGGLTTPSPDKVLLAEMVRAPLIVLSVMLFLLTIRADKRWLTVVTGSMLFWIGGIVPLCLQAGTLPFSLLLASGVEIFFQNFLAGVVTAALFWMPQPEGLVEPTVKMARQKA